MKKLKKRMFIKIGLSLLACKLAFACNKDKSLIDFNYFTVQAPEEWKRIEIKSVDNESGLILIGDKDTLFYDMGAYSNSLTERRDVKLIPLKFKNELKIDDTTNVIYVSNGKMDYDLYYRQNAVFQYKDSILIKYVFPRWPGKGITGLYIDSLKNEPKGNIKFSIFGENLDKIKQEEVISVLKTIRIKRN